MGKEQTIRKFKRRHPVMSALAGVAWMGCRVGASDDTSTDPVILPAAQQNALQIARNSAAVHQDIADVIQFLGQGLAPNMDGSGPFGGAAWSSGVGPGGGLTALPRPGAAGARIVLAPPANCSVTTQASNGQFALHDDCALSSSRHVSGTMSAGFGGACGFSGMQVSIDLTLGPAPGSADSLHLQGTIGLSFQATRLYASSALDFDASFGGHAVVDVARDCLVVDLPARAFAFDGAANHSVDGEVLLLAAAADVQQSMCQPLPYAGQFQIVGGASPLQVTFSQPDPATTLVAIDDDDDGAASELRLSAGAFRGCGAPTPKLQIDYATCGSCAPPLPPTSPRFGQ